MDNFGLTAENGQKMYQIYAVEDDINAVSHNKRMLYQNNNNVGTPSLNSHPSPAPSRVVGSPTHISKLSSAILGFSSKTSGISNSPMSANKQGFLPENNVNASNYFASPSNSLTSNERQKTQKKLKAQNNNEEAVLTLLEGIVLSDSSTPDPTLAQFEQSMLSRDLYFAKAASLNDAFKERQECPLISQIVDADLDALNTYEVLRLAEPKEIRAFLTSHHGSRYARDLMEGNDAFCKSISKLIIQANMITDLALSPSGNFVVQLIPGKDRFIDNLLCDQLVPQMFKLSIDKYGCRVIQAIIEKIHPDNVSRLVHALCGSELKVCVNKNGTHVVQRFLKFHHSHVYESFFKTFTKRNNLRQLMEDKFGCRIMQQCLESLADEITNTYVPNLLNSLIFPLLQDTNRYMNNEFANYVIQYIISHSTLKRQRDYIIDNCLLQNLLHLSQGKFSSHVVEEALKSACPVRLERMINEIFYDHSASEKGKTPLEIMLFDQFGNYVVQNILQIAIEAAIGSRAGNPAWLGTLKAVVMRNQQRLKRYSSGKKILDILETIPTANSCAPIMHPFDNSSGYYYR